jgi:hypothetical protein
MISSGGRRTSTSFYSIDISWTFVPTTLSGERDCRTSKIVQRTRTILPFNLPRSSLRYLNKPIFLPLLTKTPICPISLAENLLAPRHDDLLYDTFTFLIILLQKGQIKDGRLEFIFQAFCKELSGDQSWGLDAYPAIRRIMV